MVCKACECSIRRGLHGKYKGEFGLNKTSKKKAMMHVVVYTDFDTILRCCFLNTICEAANVTVSEEEVSSPTYSLLPMC